MVMIRLQACSLRRVGGLASQAHTTRGSPADLVTATNRMCPLFYHKTGNLQIGGLRRWEVHVDRLGGLLYDTEDM
jgi:hypothetical protein